MTLTPAKSGQYRVTLQGLPANHRLEAIECDSDDVTVQLGQRRVLVDYNDTDISCTFVLVGEMAFGIFFHLNAIVLKYLSLIFRSRIMLFETRQRRLCEKHL